MHPVKRLLIIGYPLGHTLSPLMHNTAIEALALPYRFEAEAVPPERLAETVSRFRAEAVAGFSVTIPHKEAIIPLLDSVEAEAERLGAVNTVLVEGGRFVGTNTDGVGFMRSLREDAGYEPRGRPAVVLGAGGAARAVAAHLALAEASRVFIANRTVSRAERLAEDLGRAVGRACFEPLPLEGAEAERAVRASPCIVNTTSIGMFGDPKTPVPPEWLKPGQLVCDIVYRPLRTTLLKAAESRGAAVLGGLGMLIYQGAEAFFRWTGAEMPIERVRLALEAALKAEES